MTRRISLCLLLLISCTFSDAQNRNSGFYKDLFMDSGTALNFYDDLPAAKYLGISMERICCFEKDPTKAPENELELMKKVFTGSDGDENGPLLYPDGQPRFKVIYVNGGKSGRHGKVLDSLGRENIRTFVDNGGSYVGTCAGAFLACKGTRSRKTGQYSDYRTYLGIWPGYSVSTGLEKSKTDLRVEKKSALLKYGDFGGDMQVDSVRHNGGCYLDIDTAPAGTEILMRYIADDIEGKEYLHDKVNAWAYKADDRSGRIVVTGSHPERMTSGDRLQMFAGMIEYALDGLGSPVLKGMLVDGEERRMTLRTSDRNPDFTGIGDKQYHHFAIDVPKKCKQVKIELHPCEGYSHFNLFLFAREGGFAFNDDARWFNVSNGAAKTLTVTGPKPGRLYISVFCDDTVETTNTPNGEQYTSGQLVLNGVPYTVTATILTSDSIQ